MAREAAPERRRQILDAAVRVFARQGFHSTRVADIADEADVAYGLVYHYFSSKENVLNELFVQRWSLLIEAIDEADKSTLTHEQKLGAVAGFIIDSYRYDPDLMKVIIVEVTRAANSFGRTHLQEINRAYELIGRIVADGQKHKVLPGRHRSGIRGHGLLRSDRAATFGLDLRSHPRQRPRFR